MKKRLIAIAVLVALAAAASACGSHDPCPAFTGSAQTAPAVRA
ncbi:MAG: hypothetical protein NWQ75_05950 [Schleiferiaceae bacterium]|nr:hypothetical protein [Schleiferiaceae bacterium]MDP4626752.1 hypothetical protein [Schleiferiaceae bacterium]MDP4728863.1 hypothetical protein [Schleiferiaceae bacterium]MDP4858858.1 hypothetical protein [Schleiferiaceae bacterium]MDP4901324.1 hypothetical protein [Schleiferiaceae bacterium]